MVNVRCLSGGILGVLPLWILCYYSQPWNAILEGAPCCPSLTYYGHLAAQGSNWILLNTQFLYVIFSCAHYISKIKFTVHTLEKLLFIYLWPPSISQKSEWRCKLLINAPILFYSPVLFLVFLYLFIFSFFPFLLFILTYFRLFTHWPYFIIRSVTCCDCGSTAFTITLYR